MLSSMRNRSVLLAATTSVCVILGLSLVACAQPADPTVARESLENVTEDPSPPDAAERYDAELHPEPIVDPLDDCTSVLVVTVRGTGEPAKGQLVEGIARAVAKAEPDKATVIDLDYPADTEVKEGGTLGVRTLVDTLNVQAQHCDDQRFVLLGYSQGALVIGDALSAPETRLVGATVGSIDDEVGERISAIALFGDPRFVGTEPYNIGDFDAAFNGLLPRPAGSLETYASRIADYCVADDFVCQSGIVLRDEGELNEEGHVEYFSNGMRKDAVKFILQELGWKASKTTPSPGATLTPAPEADSATNASG